MVRIEGGQKDLTVTLYDDGNGFLGINAPHSASRLDVGWGEVRVGDSGASCSRDNEGAIRYAGARLWVCNGQDWQSVALVAPNPPTASP